MTGQRSSFRLEERLREAEEWVDAMRERTTDHLSSLEQVWDRWSQSPQVIALELLPLASWEARRGCVSVIKGDMDGWTQLHAGWRYMALGTQVHIERFDFLAHTLPDRLRRGRLPICDLVGTHVNQASLCLAAAIAMHEDRFARWCGDRLVRNLKTGDPLVDKRGWRWTPFDPFMVKLYALWCGNDLDLSQTAAGPIEVYEQVLADWSDEHKFPAGLRAACDFRCANIDESEEFIPAFDRLPYDLFPAEILAMRRIRQDLGLDWPSIDHPVLEIPLMDVPIPVPRREHDELLERAIHRCRETMPDLDVLTL